MPKPRLINARLAGRAVFFPGSRFSVEIVWMNSGQSGPAPVQMLGGASGIAQGRHMFVTADLQPGKYVLLCFIPDVKDGRPHSSHGMAKEITIEP